MSHSQCSSGYRLGESSLGDMPPIHGPTLKKAAVAAIHAIVYASANPDSPTPAPADALDCYQFMTWNLLLCALRLCAVSIIFVHPGPTLLILTAEIPQACSLVVFDLVDDLC